MHYLQNQRDLLANSVNDSSKFWTTLKNLSGKYRQNNEIKMDDWVSHFTTLFESNDTDVSENQMTQVEVDQRCETDDITSDILDSPITKEEIIKSINHLGPGS